MGDHVGFNSQFKEINIGLTNHIKQRSLVIPLWVGTVSTNQRAMMFCGWGVKVGMARACESLYNM